MEDGARVPESRDEVVLDDGANELLGWFVVIVVRDLLECVVCGREERVVCFCRVEELD